MLREIVKNQKEFVIRYATTPNNHFGGELYLTKSEFKKAIEMETNSPRTSSGFNKYQIDGNVLTIGYNHREIWRSFL